MSYIGQTSRNINRRMDDHRSDCLKVNEDGKWKYNYPLYVAMRKYGFDAFNFEILEDNVSPENADDRERYYIMKYHTAQNDDKCNGYNVMFGGVHECSKYLFKISDIIGMYKDGLSYGKITELTGIDKRTLYDIFHKYGVYDKTIGINHMNAQKRKVAQVDIKTGKILNTFNSRKEAARAIGAPNHSKISLAANGKIPTAYGYIWRNV